MIDFPRLVNFMEQEDVKFMFVSLIQPCEQIAMPTMILSQMMNVFDERFYDLSNLIEIAEEYMALLERLTVMAIDCYPWYQSKPQAIACSSRIKMILALQTKFNSYKPFLYRIVNLALICCCSHPLKPTVERKVENYEPDLSEG
ncbi:unnamed protein product, partial [Rotaria magnacalcarata]